MEEGVKNRLIVILAILACIFFIISAGSCSGSRRQRLARDKEMAARLDLEEKMSGLTQDKGTLEQKLSSASENLEQEKASHEITKKALLQEQLVNQSLKEELQKITKLKEKLEEDRKEALVTSSQKTKK